MLESPAQWTACLHAVGWQKTYESSVLGRTNMADLPDASRAFEGQVLLCSMLQDALRWRKPGSTH